MKRTKTWILRLIDALADDALNCPEKPCGDHDLDIEIAVELADYFELAEIDEHCKWYDEGYADSKADLAGVINDAADKLLNDRGSLGFSQKGIIQLRNYILREIESKKG